MIKFSLKHILEHSPYELDLSGDEFMFQTNLGFTIVSVSVRRTSC